MLRATHVQSFGCCYIYIYISLSIYIHGPAERARCCQKIIILIWYLMGASRHPYAIRRVSRRGPPTHGRSLRCGVRASTTHATYSTSGRRGARVSTTHVIYSTSSTLPPHYAQNNCELCSPHHLYIIVSIYIYIYIYVYRNARDDVRKP